MFAFNFATAQRIIFGSGRIAELGKTTAEFGRRALLVTGGRSIEASGRLDRLEGLFREAGVEWRRIQVTQEPTVEIVDEGVRVARGFGADAVVAIGGGSPIDAAKAIAALLANGGEALDYLEIVGKGMPITKPSVPFIAVPTTAGTGAEATANAVIGNEARTFKRSMRSEKMLARVALVDPELTIDCPADVAATCGMDTLAQLLEALTSRRASPMTDAFAGLGLGLAAELPRLILGGPGAVTPRVREAVSLASLLSGICLANAGLGAVHGLASPIGALFPIPHGAVCGALLPAVVRLNAERGAQAGDTWLLEKYCAAAFQLIEVEDEEDSAAEESAGDEIMIEPERPEQGLALALALSNYLKDLNQRLGVRGLGHYGITPADFPRIIAGARGGSMKTNPVELSDEDLERVMEESL